MKVYRNGVEIFEIKDYKQIGRFMEVATIDATVKTPTPFEFKIGDYVVFDYNGLTYTIYDVSPEKKQARSGTYGEAFIYDLKFKADTEQLDICPFLDLVPNDNNLTYTSLPSFSTFENVRGIADRLQANMDSLYPGKWRFEVENTDDAELAEVLNEAREFSISGESCLEGLKKVYDTWGVGFIHTVDNGINVITIGKSAGKTSAFRYGKGQGLRTIKKNIQNTDQLCTRAYVYGSTRNIPARWYNEKGYIGESQHAPNLMIPPSKWTGGIPQGAYIDAIFNGEDRIEKYGLKIKTFSYDGSDGNKDEIYPSVEKVTAKIIRDAKAEIGETDNFPSVVLYPDNERMDLVLEGTALSDDGIGIEPGYQLYSDKYAAQVYPDTKTYTIAEQAGVEKYQLLTLQKSFNLCSFNIEKTSRYKINTEYNNFVKFKKNDLESTVSASLYLQKPSGALIQLRQLAFTDTLEGSLQLPKQEYSLDEAGRYTLVVKFSVSWSLYSVTPQIGSAVTLEYSIPTQFTVELARGQKILPQFFTVKIKQIGFDINNYSASSGASKSIHIKSGMCAGRTFGIAQCNYSKDDDSWVLTCKRIDDSSVSQRFPNSMFPVAKDDQFILININMPDLYVHTAMHRLYNTALEDLKHFSKPQYVIEPEIDNLQMARSPQTIKEGMYMPIEDADLSYIEDTLIDSVTITNKGTGIRTFEVALRNDKIYNRYNKLASRIAELESSVQQTVSNATVTQAPAEKEDEVIVQNSGISESDVKEITDPIVKELEEFKSLWRFDEENNAVYTPLNLIVEGTIGMGSLGEGGSGEVATPNITIKFYGSEIPYTPDANGVITLPAYPEGGGGSGEGGITQVTAKMIEEALGYVPYSSKNPSGYITSAALNGYATEQWVKQQGYLTQHQDLSAYAKSADVANTYATKVALQTLQNEHNALSTKVTNLDNLLNSDVSGVINTWGEVVDFLNEYSGSEDLATILAGMNNDIANRVLIEDFEKLEGSVSGIAGYFTSGSANNALKLGGQLPSYYATKSALDTTNGNVVSLTQKMGTAESGISTNKTNIATLTTDLSNLTSRVSTAEATIKGHTDAIELNANNIASNIKSITTNATAITAVSNRVQKFEDVIDIDDNGDVYIKGTRNFYTAGGTIGMAGLGSGGGTGGGGTAGLGSVTVRVNGQDYITDASGIVTIPNYPSLAGYATEDYVTSRGYITGISSAMVTTALGYTPLSTGGGAINGLLQVNRSNPLIQYLSSGVSVGYMGIMSEFNPVIFSANGLSVLSILHSGNYSSYALPLSGGTINGTLEINHNGTYPLIVNGADSYSVLQFTARSTRKAEVGWLNDSRGNFAFLLNANSLGALSVNEHGAYFAPSASDFAKYPILHSNNYESYTYSQSTIDSKLAGYLPLTGGVISAASIEPLMLNNTIAVSHCYMHFQVAGVTKAYVGWSVPAGAFLQEGSDWLSVKGGVVSFNANTLIHTGNYADTTDKRYLRLSGGTLTGGLTISSGNFIVSTTAGDTVVNQLYPTVDNTYVLGLGTRRWSDLYTVLINGYTPITSGNIALQSVSYADSSGYSDRLLSPYTYEGGTYISNDTSAESIFGMSYAFSAMMGNCTVFDNFATVFNFSGYKQWGATQLAVDYNNLTPRMALRNYNQSISGWTGWVEFITSANIASQSVTYATNATRLYASDAPYRYGDSNPYYLQMRYNVLGDNSWYLSVYPESPANVSVDRARKLVTSRSIFGNSFDGTADIPVTAVGHMRYLLFKDAAGTTNVGYIGRGGSTNAMELQTYGNYSLLLGAYSKNILTLAPSGAVIIGATTDYSQRLQINGNIRFIADADCEIGNAYSLTDTNAYNRIVIGNASTGIKYCSGRWTSGNVISHTFCVGIHDTSAVTINNIGYLGVNISNAAYPLDVNGDARVRNLGIDNNDGAGRGISLYRSPDYRLDYGIHFSLTSNFGTHGAVTADWATYFTMNNTNGRGWIFRRNGYGNVASISTNGDMVLEGTVAMARLASSSDRKLKANIAKVSAELSMGVIRQLKPTTWNWKKDGKKSYGLIAQEVAPIVPEMVADMGHLHLEYNQLHAFEIGAIKHIDSEVEILKRRVNELENELKQYRRNA